MKNTIRLFGNLTRAANAASHQRCAVPLVIIALIAVIGFSMAACDDGTSGGGGNTSGGNPNPGTGSTFTVTDIPPQYNGKYAVFQGWNSDEDLNLMGCQDINVSTQAITLVQIVNGSVSLPVWKLVYVNEAITSKASYSGNATIEGRLSLYESTSPDFEVPALAYAQWNNSITFSNGSAAKMWTSGSVGSGQ